MLIGTMAELIETPANAGVSMYVVAKVFDKYTVLLRSTYTKIRTHPFKQA